MSLLRASSLVLLALVPLASVAWLWSRVVRRRTIPWHWGLWLSGGGAVAALACWYAETALWSWTGLSPEAAGGSGTAAFLAAALFASPLEEGLKVLVVWPTFSSHRLDSPGLGVTFAASVAAGFAAAECVLYVTTGSGGWLPLVRSAAGVPAQLFCAGLWGYALGSSARSGAHWFGIAWLGALLVHALYDHIVFGRGPGMLIVVLPMLAAMGRLTWTALREFALMPALPQLPVLSALADAPVLVGAMRQALRRRDQPLLVHWIVLAALVNLGVVLAALAGAVYLGHRFDIDFALADETDMRSNGPLALLGAALLLAFPVAGYLVARASATLSVLEPALGAALAIVLVVALLSMTAPVALVVALAIAPVAFGLACGGAWLGIDH